MLGSYRAPFPQRDPLPNVVQRCNHRRMGKGSRLKAERASAPLPAETHEPAVPRNWPGGHVGVAITDPTADECIEVTIHGVRHYLHSTTARELSNMLGERLDEWNTTARTYGFPGV